MNRTLISLAILKINWENARADYIDNFIPFLGYLLLKKGYDHLEPDDLKNLKIDFKDEYGLLIPNYALLTICNRACKKRPKILNRDSGILYVDKNEVAKYDNSIKQKEVADKFEAIIKRIKVFAYEQFNMTVMEDEISDAIIQFLKHHDLDILFAAHDLTVLPKVNSSAKYKYIISSYAIYAKEYEKENFNALADLAIGNALACAILYSDITYTGRLKNLNLYLDTPLILTMIGLSGKFKEDAFEELLNMLKADEANLKILETTRGEVDTILSNALAVLEKGEDNINIEKAPIAVRHCLDNGITASDLEMKIAGLEETLKDHGIGKSKVPDFMKSKDFQIDEEILKQTIIDTYKTHSPDFVLTQSKDRTIDRDVKVLAGIYRFRRGFKPRSIRESKDLFVTSNTSLAYASRLYEQKQDKDPKVIPSCLTDVFIGTVLWLQTPQKVIELNEKKFIADCYAAKQPSEALIRTYMTEVDKLRQNKRINQEEYYLLRSHQTAIKLLEEKTMGDPDAITGEAIGDIIARIKADIKGQAGLDLEKEKMDHQRTKGELDNQIDKYNSLENKVAAKAECIAKWIGNSLWGLLFLFLLWMCHIMLVPGKYVASGVFGLLAILQAFLTALNMWSGFNFWEPREKLIKAIKNRIISFWI